MFINSLILFLSSFASIFATFWIYFKLLRIAREKNMVDNPDARKLQKKPVPVIGGLAVFFGIVAAVLLSSCLMDCTHLVPVLMAMTVLLFLGWIDDMIGLSPNQRFLIEILVILMMIFGGGGAIDSLHGIWGIGTFSWWIAVPLTVFIGVGIINAINLVDGVNGLSSGLCIVCSLLFAHAFFIGGDIPNAMLCCAMAGGLFPFLLHNLIGKYSRMFIGDSGTMSMGALMAWCVIQMGRHDTPAIWLEDQGINVLALSMAILSVPVFDTVRVMVMRMVQGKSPFNPDRTHLHHMLFDYGRSHALTSATEVVIDLLVCVALFVTYRFGGGMDAQIYAVIIASLIMICGLYFFLHRNYRLDTRIAFRLRKLMASMRQDDKSWWIRLQMWLDTPRKNAPYIREEYWEELKSAPERRRLRK